MLEGAGLRKNSHVTKATVFSVRNFNSMSLFLIYVSTTTLRYHCREQTFTIEPILRIIQAASLDKATTIRSGGILEPVSKAFDPYSNNATPFPS